jgi:hypothetical protein
VLAAGAGEVDQQLRLTGYDVEAEDDPLLHVIRNRGDGENVDPIERVADGGDLFAEPRAEDDDGDVTGRSAGRDGGAAELAMRSSCGTPPI